VTNRPSEIAIPADKSDLMNVPCSITNTPQSIDPLVDKEDLEEQLPAEIRGSTFTPATSTDDNRFAGL